jgi:hypothetical protein
MKFPADLPDMRNERSFLSSPILEDNHDYFREFATFFEARDRLILSRMVFTNRSAFSVGDVHIEVSIACPPGQHADLFRADDVPDEPSQTYLPFGNGIHDARRKMTIDDQGLVPVVNISLGTVRPGQVVRAEEDLAIVPSAPGHYSIQARIFANEIPAPILIEHQFEVAGDVIEVGKEDFFEKVSSSGG